MMKIYISGEHSEFMKIATLDQGLKSFEHNVKVIRSEPLPSPEFMSSVVSKSDIFIFVFSKNGRPSSWTWYEFGIISGAMSVRQNESKPPVLFVYNKPIAMVTDSWVRDGDTDNLFDYISNIIKNRTIIIEKTGVVIEEDDGYID